MKMLYRDYWFSLFLIFSKWKLTLLAILGNIC